VRNAMALYAGLKDLGRYHFYTLMVGFVTTLRLVMTELNVADITSIDPDNLFSRLFSKETGADLTDCQRVHLSRSWSMIRNCFDDYAERLSLSQRAVMESFFIRRVIERHKLNKYGAYKTWKQKQQERVKAKTDVVHSRFHHLRHLARLRFLLGCARKYVAMLNGQASGSVTSLKYFCSVIDEVGQLQISADYWKYLQIRANRLEQQWIEKMVAAH